MVYSRVELINILSPYNYEIVYKPGATNHVADALSRNPYDDYTADKKQGHVAATVSLNPGINQVNSNVTAETNPASTNKTKDFF